MQKPFEMNLLRFMLTGVDDASVLTFQKPAVRRAIDEAKREVLEKLIGELLSELSQLDFSISELTDKVSEIEDEISTLDSQIGETQSLIDSLSLERREIAEDAATLKSNVADVQLTQSRFMKLKSVYESDLQRLSAIDEGGLLLLSLTDRPCPLCGAEPQHRKHEAAAAQIQEAQAAARAEAQNILQEVRALSSAMDDLSQELATLNDQRAAARANCGY